jgi:glycosyltransferase involved in cell wall biosynthesis
VKVREFTRRGQGAVRNALFEECSGSLILWLNDDVVADPGLIEAHVRAHEELRMNGRRAMVLGSARWKVSSDDRVFDRLVRETSMVFFYDVMDRAGEAARDRDWGFRHAWTLNLSMMAEDVRQLGGFAVLDTWFFAEDIEFGFRAAQIPGGCAVIYRPEAGVEHHHRVLPREYFEREYKLGYIGAEMARRRPEASRAIMQRDVLTAEEIAWTLESLSRDASQAQRSAALMLAAAQMNAAQPESAWPLMREALYVGHLAAKRWCWRLGFMDGVNGAPLDPHRVEAVLAS